MALAAVCHLNPTVMSDDRLPRADANTPVSIRAENSPLLDGARASVGCIFAHYRLL